MYEKISTILSIREKIFMVIRLNKKQENEDEKRKMKKLRNIIIIKTAKNGITTRFEKKLIRLKFLKLYSRRGKIAIFAESVSENESFNIFGSFEKKIWQGL